MSRCFLSKNPYLLTRAFSTYVRPILEYASPIWSPHLRRDIDSLEKVQRRFTKTFHNLRFLPYNIRLERLNLQSVSLRHSNLDLCTCYRLLHHLTHLDPLLFVSPRNHSVTRGHPFTLTKPIVRLNSSKYSFFSRIVDPWNALPLAVVSFLTLPSFKYKLKYPPTNDNS